MARPLVLFGVGDTAELALWLLTHDAGRRVVGFTVDPEYAGGGRFCGLPVVPFTEVEARFPTDSHDMLIAVGCTAVNRLRAQKCREASAKGYALASYISSRAATFAGLVHGPNTFIGAGCVVQPFARLGANVMLVGSVHVGHHAVVEDDCFLAAGASIAGRTVIGRGSFIGVNATIRDRLRIGRDCVIGAGCTILADTPDQSVFAARQAAASPVPSHRLRHL